MAKLRKHIIWMLTVVACSQSLSAQRAMRRADVVPDSVAMATEALSADTAMVTPADSLANDTASQRTDLEAPVVYQSQDSMVWYKNGNAYLYGSGQVNYQKIELKANEITTLLQMHGLSEKKAAQPGG